MHLEQACKMKSTMSRDKELRGLEIFDIHPVILGGIATDIANKQALTRSQHIQAVRYWNQEIKRLREQQSKKNE